MRVAIMQPTYLPWPGYFDLMDQVDLFVFLDTVQFVKRSWQQRNQIKTPRGLEWLTVPVAVKGQFHQLISDAKINEPGFWRQHARTLEWNYQRAARFEDGFRDLRAVWEAGDPWMCLVDLNLSLIRWLSRALGIHTPTRRASELPGRGRRSGLLAEICNYVGASEYLSPMGSSDYLIGESHEFAERGIAVFFHNYRPPTYEQLFPPFQPFASAVDLLFNEGHRALEIVRSGRGEPYTLDEVAKEGREEARDDETGL